MWALGGGTQLEPGNGAGSQAPLLSEEGSWEQPLHALSLSSCSVPSPSSLASLNLGFLTVPPCLLGTRHLPLIHAL